MEEGFKKKKLLTVGFKLARAMIYVASIDSELITILLGNLNANDTFNCGIGGEARSDVVERIICGLLSHYHPLRQKPGIGPSPSQSFGIDPRESEDKEINP